ISNSSAADALTAPRLRATRRACSRSVSRQSHGDAAAAGAAAGDGDVTAVAAGDLEGDAEAQTGPALLPVLAAAAVEAIEDPAHFLRRNSGTGVVQPHLDTAI